MAFTTTADTAIKSDRRISSRQRSHSGNAISNRTATAMIYIYIYNISYTTCCIVLDDRKTKSKERNVWKMKNFDLSLAMMLKMRFLASTGIKEFDPKQNKNRETITMHHCNQSKQNAQQKRTEKK